MKYILRFLNLFKKETTNTSYTDENISINRNHNTSIENPFEISHKLIKQATSYKKTDINKAISLIKEAIDISSEKTLTNLTLDYYLKLAYYYQLAGNNDEAFSIYNTLLNSLDQKDIYFFNSNKSKIYEKLSAFSSKNKEYENYIKFYCFDFYNRKIALACCGHIECLNEILEDHNLAPDKINKKFKINNYDLVKHVLNDKLFDFYQNLKPILQGMATKTGKIFSEYNNILDTFLSDDKIVDLDDEKVDLKDGESAIERMNRLIRKDSYFIVNYNHLNSGIFEDFYEKNIKPLIK